jgi:hypothetical protein
VKNADAALIISSVAAGIGLYGAANAHRALRWQHRRDAERSATRVRLYFEHGIQADDGTDRAVAAPVDARHRPTIFRLTLVAINSGEGVVFVRDLWIKHSYLPVGAPLTQDAHEDVRLEPNQRTSAVYLMRDDNLGLSGGFIGQARLATGQIFQTELQDLKTSSLFCSWLKHNGIPPLPDRAGSYTPGD